MTIQCTVQSVEPLAENTYRVILHPQQPVNYKAGQYLMVVMGEQDKRPFSIASSPCRGHSELELHIGAAEANQYALEVVDAIKSAHQSGGVIEIDAPHGSAWVKEPLQKPLLLIAGGTGFSYVRSILDYCISQNSDQPIYLYWGAKQIEQLYAFDDLQHITTQHNNITFIPVVEIAPERWTGKVGNVLQAVNQDFDSLADYEIYIAGRFEMAGAARDTFTTNKDADIHHIHGDAFAFI
jgi:aquacobalamin reductase/NAD(P)H-flavin reductase